MAFHFGLVQAFGIPATHRPMEHKFRRCSRIRLMDHASVGGTNTDIPDSEIENTQHIVLRLDVGSALAHDACRSFTRFSSQDGFAIFS